MPDWTSNKLTVAGDASSLTELLATVSGVSEDGERLPLSLQAIDPMPPEYKTGANWGDSDEFARLRETLAGTPEHQKMAFIRENRGFSFEIFSRTDSGPPPDGWLGWRYQHWGTRRELTSGTKLELNDDGSVAVFEFDSALDDIAPAVSTLAARFPQLTFTLFSASDLEAESTTRVWRDAVLTSEEREALPADDLDE